MITLNTTKFEYYLARMNNGDWKDQTIKNMASEFKGTRSKLGNFEDYLAIRCAYETYKVNRFTAGL